MAGFNASKGCRVATICVVLALGSMLGGVARTQPAWHASQAEATADAAGEIQLSFAVIGDYGAGTTAEADVASLVKSWDVDFVATVGDNNYPDGSAKTIDKNIGKYYADYIYPYNGSYSSTATSNRFFPALGNHDWHTIRCTNSSCDGPYFDYFTLPGNERYYDFTRGDVHVFVVDSEPSEPDGVGPGSRQAIWLRNALASSTAGWQIVLLHHAPYSSAKHGSTTRTQWPFAEWGADVVIAGHDHVYERKEREGIVYLVNGLGGKSIYPFPDAVSGSTVRYNDDYGAIYGSVDSAYLTLQFITRTGRVVDEMRIARDAQASLSVPPETVSGVPVFVSAFPNPVISRTTIQYELTAPSFVTLSVFDLLGRHVSDLASGIQAPGAHQATWDVLDRPAGLYLIRLQAAGTVETRQIVVLK